MVGDVSPAGRLMQLHSAGLEDGLWDEEILQTAPSADPDSDDVRMLEQQQEVWHPPRLPLQDKILLEYERLAIRHDAQPTNLKGWRRPYLGPGETGGASS